MGIAFLALLERKILRYIQIRKGRDSWFNSAIYASKLFRKDIFIVVKSNYIIFYVCPIIL